MTIPGLPIEKLKRWWRYIFAGAIALVVTAVNAQYLASQRRILNAQFKELEEQRKKIEAEYRNTVEVVVAAKDVPEGAALETSMLKPASVPERFAQPYVARSAREVLGKVTMAPLAQDEQVLTTKLRRPEDRPAAATLSGVMPQGTRAVSIVVDAITGVGGFVRPGDNVDILWTFQLPKSAQQEGQVVTLTLFQNVPVLAIGGETSGAKKAGAKAGDEGGQYLATLALGPQETSFLLFAREQGRIQLSLRPRQGEEAIVAIAPANINTLLEAQLGIKPPDAPAPVKPPTQVEVYKGLKRDVVTLPQDK